MAMERLALTSRVARLVHTTQSLQITFFLRMVFLQAALHLVVISVSISFLSMERSSITIFLTNRVPAFRSRGMAPIMAHWRHFMLPSLARKSTEWKAIHIL